MDHERHFVNVSWINESTLFLPNSPSCLSDPILSHPCYHSPFTSHIGHILVPQRLHACSLRSFLQLFHLFGTEFLPVLLLLQSLPNKYILFLQATPKYLFLRKPSVHTFTPIPTLGHFRTPLQPILLLHCFCNNYNYLFNAKS